MAYDEAVAERIRRHLEGEPGVTERRMFGGLAFLVDGHMAVASGSDGVLLRVDPDTVEGLLGDHVRRMEMQGRPMKGWLHLDPEAVAGDEQLGGFVDRGVAYVRGLPPK